MTDWASAPQDFAAFEPSRRARSPLSQSVLCAIALVATTSVGLGLFYARAPVGSPTLSVPQAAPLVPRSDIYGALVAPAITTLDVAPTFVQNAPLGVDVAWLRGALAEADAPTVVASVAPQATDTTLVSPVPAESDLTPGVPLPPPRPLLSRLVDPAKTMRPRGSGGPIAASAPEAVASAPPAQPSFFERLFGRPSPSGTALAYAPEDGGLGGLLPGRATTSDREMTAIYDISAHTVTLPDGTRLEAHSGLGVSHDDPRSVAEHMHGATPPNVYALDLREAPFHGVRALRLTPVGSGDTYGRGGLLAHSYMLGPRGDSNGCVVFKNYDAFLQAFESGRIKRLMVVARL